MNKKLNIFLASFIFSVILWGSISLSDIYYTNIDVKLTLTNFPKGYTTGSILPDELKIRVKGEGWRLVSINVGPETEFKVSVGDDSGWHHINLYNYLDYLKDYSGKVNEIFELELNSLKYERSVLNLEDIRNILEQALRPVLYKEALQVITNDIKKVSKKLGIIK